MFSVCAKTDDLLNLINELKNTKLMNTDKSQTETNTVLGAVPFKRYLLFFGDCYYPSGGMQDFKKDFDSTEDAIIWLDEYVNTNKIYDTVKEEWEYRWAHIYDNHQRKIVWNR